MSRNKLWSNTITIKGETPTQQRHNLLHNLVLALSKTILRYRQTPIQSMLLLMPDITGNAADSNFIEKTLDHKIS